MRGVTTKEKLKTKQEIEGEDIVEDDEVDQDTDQLTEDTSHAIPTMDVAVGKFLLCW